MDRHALLQRAAERGVNPVFYALVRAVLTPFFRLWFRLDRIGREHLPAEGPVILAANHRSFLDPFVIATMARRPIYFVAKQELFERPLSGRILNALGAFPIDRGAADADAMATARAILERGDGVLIFPEGTRHRTGSLGAAKRGVGRLALETGAPVVPIAVTGTEHVRRGVLVRPRKVRIRAGRPLTFPRVEHPSPALAGAVTDRIWPCVGLQWEWLGGLPPLRRVAVIGAGEWGTALAVCLRRAGLEVQLGCRTATQVAAITQAGHLNERALPGVGLDGIDVVRAQDLELARADVVVLAVPNRALPAVVASHAASIPSRAGVVLAARGLVAESAATPVAYVRPRVGARAVACLTGPADAGSLLAGGASLLAAGEDTAFLRQLADAFAAAAIRVSTTSDVRGVELAGAAKDAAALAARAAAPAGAAAAGAAAGAVFAEVHAYARRRGAHDAFTGPSGVGGLVAAVLDDPADHEDDTAGDGVVALAGLVAGDGPAAPALAGLAAVVEGREAPERWVRRLTEPAPAGGRRARRAA